MTQQLLLLEFNEVNFEDVRHYADRGLLPNLQRLIETNGWATTASEQRYQDIEPWVQWVTAHTGKSLDEHRVFRLGDILKCDLPQIWECLEARGLRVGALGPMNAKHRLRDPAFFVPDFWTQTSISAPPALARLHKAISQFVGDNAEARVNAHSVVALLAGLAGYAARSNYSLYASLLMTCARRHWRRAIVLDVLLSDVFVSLVKRTCPHFASLFLNAGAHIQHHYLFSGQCYSGPSRNPRWYVDAGIDPILDVYSAYDRILGNVRARFPAARVMIATGLHQDPHGEGTYYWRLRNHARFLRRIGVSFVRVEPRMSRDFVIVCRDAQQALQAQVKLTSVTARDGVSLFEVDNRGDDVFVTLTYSREISAGFDFRVGSESFSGFEKEVVFVALKNGHHNGTGYFLDTAADFRGRSVQFELREMPNIIGAALGVDDPMVGNMMSPRSDAA